MFGKILYNVIAASISILSGLLRNKIFAAFLTINLFGILSIGQQSASLLFMLFAFGLPLGITSLSSELVTKSLTEQIETVSRIVVLTVAVSISFTALLLTALLIDPYIVSTLVTSKSEYVIPVSIVLFSAPLMVIQNCLYAIMEGMGKLKEIVLFKIMPAIVILPILYVLTSRQYLVGATIGLVMNEAMMVGTGLFLLRKHVVISRSAFQVNRVFLSIFKVAVLSFGVGVAWLVCDFGVKRYMLELLGELNNGIVQSVAKIVDLYPTIALSWLTMHLFPVLAMNLNQKSSMSNALDRTVFVAVSIVIPIILVLFAFRAVVLEVVYKEEFIIAVEYFGAMLSIGILKVFGWVIGIALLPIGLRKQWFYSAMVLTVVYVLGVWIGLANKLSIYAIPVAYGFGLCVQIVYVLHVYSNHGIVLGNVFKNQFVMYILLSILLVASIFWTPILIIVALMYLGFIYHYKLIDEVKTRIYELGKKTAS